MRKVEVKKKVLAHNDEIAGELRREFNRRKLPVLNLVSSPGSGKTSLLEQTIKSGRLKLAVLTGDVQTENDVRRLHAAGLDNAFQIVTQGACHLDASMIKAGLDRIDLDGADLLLIENVGNLVCPSSYDLGEDMKVVIISVAEGDDKPLKYPGMFRRSSLMIVNKIDLSEQCDFDISRAIDNARSINGDLEFIQMSCRTGQGVETWFGWLERQIRQKRDGVQARAVR